jgi:hypothetical protein
MRGMPIPSRALKDQVEGSLDHYASQAWPQLEEVTIGWRGSYGYLVGHSPDDDLPLARIEYLGDPQHWAFALYQASTENYQETVLPSGQWTGTPKEALDCACAVHLAALGEHGA